MFIKEPMTPSLALIIAGLELERDKALSDLQSQRGIANKLAKDREELAREVGSLKMQLKVLQEPKHEQH